jgi:hypothetical protein
MLQAAPRSLTPTSPPPPPQQSSACPRGEICPCARNAFKCWLRPTRAATAPSLAVRRQVQDETCFFAHALAELRVPSCKPILPGWSPGHRLGLPHPGAPERLLSALCKPSRRRCIPGVPLGACNKMWDRSPASTAPQHKLSLPPRWLLWRKAGCQYTVEARTMPAARTSDGAPVGLGLQPRPATVQPAPY